MTYLRKIGFVSLMFLALGLVTAAQVKADPLTFSNVVALQDNQRVDLLANPGVTLFGPRISFLVDIAGMVQPGTTNLLSIVYTEAGSAPITLTYSIPAFGTIPPPYSQLFTIDSPGATIEPRDASLSIIIFSMTPGSTPIAYLGPSFTSHTYNFLVAQPVPEPTTLLLLGTGILGLWAKRRRREPPA
jgi:hypothetical protein